jgi:hypothetical protein
MPKSTTQFVRMMAVLMLAMSLLGLNALAQSTTDGAIGGIVTDQTGAVIPNATVTATNNGTNATATATSDASGRYRVIQLKPGTYTVAVKAANFAGYKAQNIIVEVGRITNVEAKLSVSTQTEAVDVTGEAPVINTQAPDLATNINQTSISELPINGRRWSQYALLTPGATPDGNFGLISFRGISGLLNNNTVDGGDNNQAFFAEERGRTRISYVISQDAIQEFQVNTSNYSAEYGRSAGGVVNAVTKSGTNGFHGDAFWYIRDNELGATNSFTKAFVNGVLQPVKPEDRRQQWGGSIGGPILKDKLFFFFSYDQQHRNFPGIAAPNNPNTFFAPLTAGELTTLAGRGVNAATANAGMAYLQSLSGQVSRKGDQDIFLPKIDWKINDKNSLAIVYNRMRWDSPAGVQTQAAVSRGIASFGNDGVKVDTLNLKLSSALSNTVSNELRFSTGRDFEFQRSQTPAPGEPTSANGFPPTAAIDTSGSGWTIGKPNFLERKSYPMELRTQVANSTSIAWGKHLLKFGADWNRVNDELDNLFQEAGAYTYNNRVDFLSDWGNPAANKRYSNFQQGLGPSRFVFTTHDYNAFFQDDWRIHPRLTINLGLRYENERLPAAQVPNALLPLSKKFPTDNNNFGPRVGFAWDPQGNGKMSMRGGWGYYYGRVINSTISNAITNTGVTSSQLQYFFTPSTAGSPTYPNIVSAGSVRPDVVVFDRKFELPRVMQFDFNIEREIGWGIVASASYIGSRGDHLPNFIDTNLNPAGPTGFNTFLIQGGPKDGQSVTVPFYQAARPNTNFNRITAISSKVESQYDAFVAQVNKRMSHGLQVQMSYTYAEANDNGQSSQTFTTGNSVLYPSNLAIEQGRSNFDIRHRFVSSLVWQPAYFQNGNAIVKHITENWTIAPIIAMNSGKPYTATLSGNTISGSTTSGITGAAGSTRVPFDAINAYSFPAVYNVDLRLSRRVKVKEGMNLEFLSEAFNLFNHRNITDIQTREYTYNSATTPKTLVYNTAFGSATGASSTLYRERQIQFAIRMQF